MSALHNYQRCLQEKEQSDLQAEFRKALQEQEEVSSLIDLLHISHNASGLEANIRVLMM